MCVSLIDLFHYGLSYLIIFVQYHPNDIKHPNNINHPNDMCVCVLCKDQDTIKILVRGE